MSTEFHSDFPENWLLSPLGEVIKPTRPRVKPSEMPDLPFIGMEHIEAHTMRLLGSVPAGTMKSSAVHFQPGDVLYGRLRPYLNKVYRPDFEGLCSAEFIVFPNSEHIDSKYLQYFLNSWEFVSFASHLNEGDRPRVDFKQLSPFPFPLPPQEQQTSIVAEIEKQFSRLDEAVANLGRVKANLKRYKAAVLKAAVEGKLTEEWRRGAIHRAHSPAERDNQGVVNQGAMNCAPTQPVETGAELLQRILAERRANWQGKGKYKEPVGPDTSGLPELPAGWVWTAMGQVFDVCVGATPSRGKPEYWNGTIPWVSSGEVAFCRIKKTRETITDIGLQNTSTKLHPPGTILLGMIGEGKTRGQVAILDIWATNNQNSAAIRVSETDVVPEYIYLFLEQEYENTRKRGSGGNQLALNKSRVEQIPLPLPPLAEQHQIVAEVERRLSIVAEAEAQVAANLRRADRLRQSILKQAFSGQLVPQDPNDEPASVLLERIQNNVGARFIAPGFIAPKSTPRQSRKTRIEQDEERAQSIAPLQETITAILAAMHPGREYSRADLAEPLGLTTGKWNAAIQELKRVGKIRQVGEKRGARYLLVSEAFN